MSLLSKSESVKFLLIESAICLFTDSSMGIIFLLLNQLILTDQLVKTIFSTVKSVTLHWSKQWNSTDLHTEKTVSLNQRNISLIYGQRKNFFE